MENPVERIKPLHVFFNSDLDSPEDWREALVACLGPLEFTIGPDCVDPDSVDVALVWTLPPDGLHRFRNLEAVLSLGAGINQLDPAGLPRGVPVARLIDGSLTRTMVEYARATVFRYHKRLDLYERLTRKAEWRFMPPVSSGDTSIGILGLGVIGRAIADALAADGFAVHGWSRGAKSSGALKTYAGPDGLAELLPQVDILVNVLPLTAETRFILNRDMFSRVRPGTRLINIGRGAHLVEQDLVDAMQAGQIGGATLDVHSVEPLPPDHVFWTTPGILITPHVAGMSLPAEASANVAENIRRALARVELLNQVDFTRGY